MISHGSIREKKSRPREVLILEELKAYIVVSYFIIIIIIIIIIIWGANHPYSQLELNCEGRGYNVFEKQACKGDSAVSHINPL